ncbi:MAG: ATP-binding protein [Melioribacteraceae bacterium]|nr:ATP-binding protein [Melioribacteraceae bacterium]
MKFDNFKSAVIQPKSILLIFVITAFIIISISIIEIKQSQNDLLELMENQSHSLLEGLSTALENSLIINEEIEKESEEKLFNNAAYIKFLYEKRLLTNKLLEEFANSNKLFRINIFNNEGEKLFSSHSLFHNNFGSGADPKNVLADIFENETDTLVIGLRSSNNENNYRYAIAIAASDRSAIVLNVDAEYLVANRKKFGFGSLLNKFALNKNYLFAAVQDTSGIIAASANIPSIEKINDSEFLFSAMKDSTFAWRINSINDQDVFEAVHPFSYNGKIIGLLRIGLSLDNYDDINSRIFTRTLIMGIVLLIFGSVLFSLVFLKQNFNILQKRYKSVEQLKNQILERNERLKATGRLASGVAHEIRNPLNTIGTIAQQLNTDFKPESGEEEYSQLTSLIYSEVKRINKTIENFLRFAKPLQLSKSVFNLNTFCSELYLQFEKLTTDKEIRVKINCPDKIEVNWDRNQIKQVFINLIQNAIDSISSNGEITITVSISDNIIIIKLSDTGKGILEEEINKIFDLYYTTKSNGNGIGLSIVNKIIAEHGGTISVSSNPNINTIFKIELPQDIQSE